MTPSVISSAIAGLSAAPEMPNLPNFAPEFDLTHRECKTAHYSARMFCARLRALEAPLWLSLLGRSGVGKTHLAKSIAAIARPLQPMPVFWRWRTVCGLLRDSEWNIIDQLRSQPVLVLDDLTADYAWPLSAWDNKTFRTLSGLLDYRVGKWTVLTDNLCHAELAERDMRIASRMKRNGGIVVEFRDCPDFTAIQKQTSAIQKQT